MRQPLGIALSVVMLATTASIATAGCAADAENEEDVDQSEDELVWAVPVALRVCWGIPPCRAAVIAGIREAARYVVRNLNGIREGERSLAVSIAQSHPDVIAAGAATGAMASRTRRCTPTVMESDLADNCTCEELSRRYSQQNAVCIAGSCTTTTSCGEIDHLLRVSRNCADARRSVQTCFRRPDFDGHQQQIRAQCNRFATCVDRARRCGTDVSIPPLPTPCQ